MRPPAADPAASAAAFPDGLATAEAARRLAQFGPNAVVESRAHPLWRMARHFWSPVPWMLEVTIALQLAIGERVEPGMIAALLVLNVALGVFQENRADAALALLKERLSLRARVRRDGAWCECPAADLVPDDIVHLALGAVVPADVLLLTGTLLIDQSMLTGESMPVEVGPGGTAYAGGFVRRGEAVGRTVATGTRTYFGRTAELVRTTHVESSEQRAVLGVVRNLTILNFAIVIGIVAYAAAIHMTVAQIIALVLTALLSAVPVALPATFTLASTLGARTLARQGVLLTRLAALHEAAMIDVLCVDKTGTLTRNELAVEAVAPLDAARSTAEVLTLAALASSPDGRDRIDAAICAAAGPQALVVSSFEPFDPATKIATAVAVDHDGTEIRIVKGAPAVVAAIVPFEAAATHQIDAYAAAGYRTIAIAAGPSERLTPIGLIAFGDPPRSDSRGLLGELRTLGVRPVMITGDAAATAATVARAIGLVGNVCPSGQIPETAGPDDFAVYAGVFPEDKFRLVRAFQRQGHSVGMCGDGANDAPALRQAQTGIAVSTATDVAKAAAGIVLTDPGLGGIVAAIREGRSGFQRILTYTLSLLVNKSATLVVFGIGLVITGHAVLTPFLQALSMLAGDLVTMSRAADRARPSPYPNAWRIRNLTLAAIPIGLFKLGWCLAVLAAGWFAIGLTPGAMQTLTFLTLIFAGQANTYALRERGYLWSSRPAAAMLAASAADLAIVISFAAAGLLMTPLPLALIGLLFGATAGFALAHDAVKRLVFEHLEID